MTVYMYMYNGHVHNEPINEKKKNGSVNIPLSGLREMTEMFGRVQMTSCWRDVR